MGDNFLGRTADGSRVWVDIQVKDGPNGPEVGISAGITYGRRNDFDACGQIKDDVRAVVDFTGSSFTEQDRDILLSIWDGWHLNHMQPGCPHQMAAGWDTLPIDPEQPTNTYGRHFPGQRQDSWNMLTWVRPDEHPAGLLTVPCPECGHRYGTSWEYAAVPEDLLAEARRLASLPVQGVPSWLQ